MHYFRKQPPSFKDGLIFLPGYYFIYKLLLFAGGTAKVNACCLNALMPHKVGKQSNIIVLFKEVLFFFLPPFGSSFIIFSSSIVVSILVDLSFRQPDLNLLTSFSFISFPLFLIWHFVISDYVLSLPHSGQSLYCLPV